RSDTASPATSDRCARRPRSTRAAPPRRTASASGSWARTRGTDTARILRTGPRPPRRARRRTSAGVLRDQRPGAAAHLAEESFDSPPDQIAAVDPLPVPAHLADQAVAVVDRHQEGLKPRGAPPVDQQRLDVG